jgi:proteasome lid subunit RPN8/RPN11
MHQLQSLPVTLRHPDPFSPTIVDSIKKHAVECYPEESCGVVVSTKKGPIYVPCKNVHAEPTTSWKVSAEQTAKALTKGDILAVVHSHPEGPNYPSVVDQTQQIAGGEIWGIVPVIGTDVGNERVPVPSDILWWGDNLPPVPLERRRFIWGIFHCYQLYRDWFKQEYGVLLPTFAYSFDTFAEEDVFVRNCERVGFRNLGLIDMKNLLPGDMLVGHIRGRCPNHCGVYLGGDDFLHHPQNGVSGIALLSRWWEHIDTVFRYERHIK